MNDNVLGQRIKELRNNSNLSQIELASKLNIANSTLSQYEAGNRIPSDSTKRMIAKLFNVSLDYLMGNTDTMQHTANQKREQLEYDDFMESVKLHFLDADEADKDAIFRDISNIYFESKEINKKKYARNKKKD